ncbi:MAG: SPOR domain-containing protein [Xanthobacteraceae bacterium]
MTDDNARYRSNDPFARTPDQGGHGSDPLAELARLIGQNDPFADLAREQQHAEPPRAPQPYDDPAPQNEQYHHADHHNGQPAHDPRYDAPYPADPAPHFVEPAPLPPDPAPVVDWHKQPPFDPFAPASSRGPESHAADRHRDEAPSHRTSPAEYSFPSPHSPQARPSNSSSYDAPPSDAPFAAPSHHEPAGTPSPPFHLASGRAPSPPPLDEYYDDAPQGGRRKGLITVAAVFMLAVVGTAGAFGYRTWFGGPSVKPAPAVIRASAEPAKVAPPALAVDPNANKISYDRFGDRGQNEKVVPREEKPVDVRDATRTGSAMSQVPLPSQQAAAATPNGGTPPSVLTDPKKVRTVTIRPDAPDNSIARPPIVTPPAQAAPARQAAAGPSNAPLDLANPASPPQQARAAAVRQTPPSAVRPAPAPTSGNAPLSLAPENAPLPPPGTARAAAPTRVAAAPAASGNGSYLVQVSSQRSEADAQVAFRSVKSKYSSVLGNRQPVIRRADVTGKGTYYRAMVGPFTTRDQAIQLCSSLKAAGGDCVVQAN